jgi:hypothetical protein
MMKVLRVIVIFCVSLAIASSAVAQASGSYTTVPVDEDWAKDVDKKLDTTIKVLEVIKEELDDYKKTEEKAAKVTSVREDAEANWAARAAAAVRRLLRAWRKVKKVTASEEGGVKAPDTSAEEARMTRDISNKLDQTIKAMTAIKTELDKMEEDMEKESN